MAPFSGKNAMRGFAAVNMLAVGGSRGQAGKDTLVSPSEKVASNCPRVADSCCDDQSEVGTQTCNCYGPVDDAAVVPNYGQKARSRSGWSKGSHNVEETVWLFLLWRPRSLLVVT